MFTTISGALNVSTELPTVQTTQPGATATDRPDSEPIAASVYDGAPDTGRSGD